MKSAMKKVLVVNSSVSGEKGQSSQLIEQFIQALPAGFAREDVDLAADAYPHLAMPELAAWMTPVADRSAEQQALAAISDQAIAAVESADVILVGVPMYNFGVPTQLKSWFDRLARAGITFKYTEQGPVGLLQNKPVIFFATRGGIYKDLPADSQTPFLKSFFSFIGLTDLHFIYAEGLNMGADSAQQALAAAKAQIGEVSAKIAA
jgi:FMN-dependent NADH-azoreductase